MTYLLLGLAFTVPTILVSSLVIARRGASFKPIILAILVLLVATTIGDNLIIQSGIVAYDSSKILGIRVGVAPIEDYAYSIAAVFVVSAVWAGLEKR